MPLICTPIKASTQAEVIHQMNELKNKVDVAEIWLDQIHDLDVAALLRNRVMSVLCVCKKPNEGGKFKGDWQALSEVLLEAKKAGAEYVDIPLQMPKSLSTKFVQQRGRTKVILSFHDFEKTPSAAMLQKKALQMHKLGADIVKIAVQGNTLEEVIRVIALAEDLKHANIKHILISMGESGTLSRVLTPHLGGTLMFAPIKPSEKTAPGQLTAKELRSAWNLVKSSHT